MSSNKFLEGIPVLPTRFATWAPLRKSSQKRRNDFSLPLSLCLSVSLTAYSPSSSPRSYHSFRCWVRYTRSRVDVVVVDRRKGICIYIYTHKSKPDFQHLLQSRKTTVWNDFSLAKAFTLRAFSSGDATPSYILLSLPKAPEHMFSNCSQPGDGQMID